MRQNQE